MFPCTPVTDVWYNDPRWLAIGVTFLIGVTSLGLQAFYRHNDTVKKSRAERFETDIAEDVRACFVNLRKVVPLVLRIAEKSDIRQRRKLADQLKDEEWRLLINDLWSTCLVADESTQPQGELFVDIAAALEDEFENSFERVYNDTKADWRRKAALAIQIASRGTELKLRRKLTTERKRYRG